MPTVSQIFVSVMRTIKNNQCQSKFNIKLWITPIFDTLVICRTLFYIMINNCIFKNTELYIHFRD